MLDPLVLALIAVGVLIVLAVAVFMIIRGWIRVARADEALVISGRTQKTAEGTSGLTVVVNGRALVNPITQRSEVISLRSRQVAMTAEAQSEDNVTLKVEAVAIVKIGSNPDFVRRAAERFASQDRAIDHFTTEQLEGALRGVVATLSVTDLMRERKKFSEQIAQDVATELAEQGLVLDSFQIKGITDDSGYIKSLGTPQIEAKRLDAEVAQANAERAITQRRIAVSEENLIEQTQFEANRAASDAQVGAARAQAEQAEALARAKAEQDVLQQQAENKQAALDAEVKRVADARLYEAQKRSDAEAYESEKQAAAQAVVVARQAEAAKNRAQSEADAEAYRTEREAQALRAKATAESEATALKAKAEADAERARGEARAASIKAEAEALRENQEAILLQRIVEVLPQLAEAHARGYAQVGQVSVFGGGAGEHLAGEQASSMAAAFQTVKAATGIDFADIIQGQAKFRGAPAREAAIADEPGDGQRGTGRDR